MKRKTVKPLDLSTPEAPETGPAPEDVFAAPYAEPDSDLDMEPSPREAPPVAEADPEPEPPLTMGVAESADGAVVFVIEPFDDGDCFFLV